MSEVNTYLENIKLDWQAEIGKQLHALIQQAIPDVTERIQYGKPHYLKNGKYVCVLGTAKGWISLTLFHAEHIEAPEGTFEASDVAERKTIKFRQGQAVDEALLARLIAQAADAV